MRPRQLLTLSNFFCAAHFFLIAYIITPYLATFMPATSTGLVVSLGAVITLVVFPFMPRLVVKFGPRRLAIYLSLLMAVVLGWLGLSPSAIPAVILIALACGISPLLDYQLDLLLEATVAKEDSTGRIRTLFITAGNLTLIITPLIIGLTLREGEEYGRVFLIAAATLLPFIGLMATRRLPEGTLPTVSSLLETALCLVKDRDLRTVGIANIALQFFYHLAPLYIPLYLHDVIGMPWSQLGWIFAVMLLPFVLLEYPAGWLADRKLGDKELMVVGFVITGIAFAAISYIHVGTSIAVIVAILVATRIGAALVEAMVEGHFFRRVSAKDVNTVSLFRTARPVGALIAPILGSIILSIGSYSTFFIVTGVLTTIVGVIAALRIRDSR